MKCKFDKIIQCPIKTSLCSNEQSTCFILEVEQNKLQEKESKINQVISNFKNNANNLTVSLIQGEPHYFNFIIHNDSNIEQKL